MLFDDVLLLVSFIFNLKCLIWVLDKRWKYFYYYVDDYYDFRDYEYFEFFWRC